jgi:hypothetical protein
MEIFGYLMRNYFEVRDFALALFTVTRDGQTRQTFFGESKIQVASGIVTTVVQLPFNLPSAPIPSRQLRGALFALLVMSFLISGCGRSTPEPTATPETIARALVPTFTPTPVQPPTATPEPPTATPLPVVVEPTAAPTATPDAAARLVITSDIANVRQGPGTVYSLLGSASRDEAFEVLAKNPAGDWWQICCVNGQPGWVFGELARIENAQQVAVAQDIPTPPPVPTPPPTATPVPQPVASDPCAGIGGDGCKFKVTGGPKVGDNGGTELKIQLFFIHSGVEGGQPQGSYFIWLEKDGQKLPISDSVRSIALARNEGPLGPYNYEYKLGPDKLPGNTVAGSYVGWVLDGNGERDSQNFSFQLGEGQGHVWIQFDQN